MSGQQQGDITQVDIEVAQLPVIPILNMTEADVFYFNGNNLLIGKAGGRLARTDGSVEPEDGDLVITNNDTDTGDIEDKVGKLKKYLLIMPLSGTNTIKEHEDITFNLCSNRSFKLSDIGLQINVQGGKSEVLAKPINVCVTDGVILNITIDGDDVIYNGAYKAVELKVNSLKKILQLSAVEGDIVVPVNKKGQGGGKRRKCSSMKKRNSCNRRRKCSWTKKSKRSRGHCRKSNNRRKRSSKGRKKRSSRRRR